MIRSHVFLLGISFFLITGMTTGVHSSSAGDFEQIKPEELKRLIESNDPNFLVVDTQPKGAYDLAHIKGAINFPWAMDIKSPGDLPRDKTLILYCDCTHEEDSADPFRQFPNKSPSCTSEDDSIDAAEQLTSKFGYKNIKILEGGWSRWQQLGYPTDKK